MSNLSKRLLLCFKLALKKASKTVIWLLKIILPISLFVSFLQFFGVIDWLSLILSPLFAYLGLPGEAAIDPERGMYAKGLPSLHDEVLKTSKELDSMRVPTKRVFNFKHATAVYTNWK